MVQFQKFYRHIIRVSELKGGERERVFEIMSMKFLKLVKNIPIQIQEAQLTLY